MLKKTLLIVSALLMAGTARAGAIPQPGDFYLISRDRSGIFVGSHKLFQDYTTGLKQVTYCRRAYYVRSHSVAWTQLEAELGHTVRVEYNFGRGWRPICDNPERQVTLKDIGINASARDVLAGEADEKPKSRLAAIGAVFQVNKPEDAKSTFHTR